MPSEYFVVLNCGCEQRVDPAVARLSLTYGEYSHRRFQPPRKIRGLGTLCWCYSCRRGSIVVEEVFR